MMMLLSLLLLCIAFFHKAEACSKTDVMTCLMGYIDANADQTITVKEVNDFMMAGTQNQGIVFSGEALMEQCDQNGDNALTEADYDHPFSCIKLEIYRDAVCSFCGL